MSRLDRQFSEMRNRAMAHPLTRADRMVFPEAQLPGGVSLALSVNL